MNLGELFISLGFDVDDKKLKAFKEDIKDGLEGLLKISGAAAGAVYAINAFVEGSVRSATAMRNFNVQTGLSIDTLQKWQLAGTMSNTAMSVDQVTSSVQALQQSIADISMGKGPSGDLAMLGIDTRGKDAFDVLEEMRKNYKANVAKWGLKQTNSMIAATGIDPALINAIQLTRTEFDKLYEGKILKPEAREKLVALGVAMESFKQRFKLFKDNISADWSPTLIKYLDQGIPLLEEFAQSVKNVGVALKEIEKALYPFRWFIMIGGAALVAVLNPVGAAIGLILMGLNEWGKHLQGLPNAIDPIISAFKRLADAIAQLFANPLKTMNAWMDRLEELINKAKGKSSASYDYDSTIMDRVPDNFFDSDMAKIMDRNLDRGVASDRAMAGMAAANQNNFNNVYHIHSVADAFGVADEINSHQRKQLNYAYDGINNGPPY